MIEEKKPLFLPLMGCYFDNFEDGSKDTEYRMLRPRSGWNLKNCYPGRKIVLSRGYGKKRRMLGVIEEAKVVIFGQIPNKVRLSMFGMYASIFDFSEVITIKIKILEKNYAG